MHQTTTTDVIHVYIDQISKNVHSTHFQFIYDLLEQVCLLLETTFQDKQTG